MAIWQTVTNFIASIFKPAVELVDELHTSGEEKGAMKNKLEEIRANVTIKLAELEVKLVEHQAKIAEMQARVIVAESEGKGFLQKMWRPFTMIVFNIMLILTFFGVVKIDPDIQNWMMAIITTGLGGYVLGRSGEKIATKIANSKNFITK